MSSAAKWPWSLPERKGCAYTKRLEGIRSTPELRAVLEQIILNCTTDKTNASKVVENDNGQDELGDASFYSMPQGDAIAVIQEYLNKDNDEKSKEAPDATTTAVAVSVVSLDVIRAAVSLMPNPSLLLKAMMTTTTTTKHSTESPTKTTHLVFTPPPPPPDKTSREARRFEKRMDQLRLRAEEMKYKQLTHNLDTTIADDVTTKSMTYAASVGLNMIVAPISFGVFMYFFAGQIFAWISGSNAVPLKPHEVDIKRVIAGVVSGVGMLFIEMILFVIRTHTMDKSMREKAKRKKMSPFGYTKPDAAPVEGIRGG